MIEIGVIQNTIGCLINGDRIELYEIHKKLNIVRMDIYTIFFSRDDSCELKEDIDKLRKLVYDY